MDPLEKRELGGTGLRVTRTGLGCSGLGGMYGDIPDEQAYDVVARALSLGINLFDTALRMSSRIPCGAVSESYPALAKLRSEGVIKGVSVGMNRWPMLVDFASAGEFDCFLIAGRYSILDQSALDELLPLCVEKNIGIMAGGTYNTGILAKGAEEGKFNYREPPRRLWQRSEPSKRLPVDMVFL